MCSKGGEAGDSGPANQALHGQGMRPAAHSPPPSLPGRLVAVWVWPIGTPRLLCDTDDVSGDFSPEPRGAKAPLPALAVTVQSPTEAECLCYSPPSLEQDKRGLHTTLSFIHESPMYRGHGEAVCAHVADH